MVFDHWFDVHDYWPLRSTFPFVEVLVVSEDFRLFPALTSLSTSIKQRTNRSAERNHSISKKSQNIFSDLSRQAMSKINPTDCLSLLWSIILECGLMNVSWTNGIKLQMSLVCVCFWCILIGIQSDNMTEILQYGHVCAVWSSYG